MAQRRKHHEDDQAELRDAALDESLRVLAEDGAAVVAIPGRVVLCQSPRDVETALAGRIPPGAVRLDGRRPG